MASLPLPALDIQPPQQQPGALDQYSKVVGLQSLLGQQKTQQLTQTALSQENQQRQVQLDDQNAIKKAMLQFDPTKHDLTTDLPKLMMQNKGSPQGAMALQNQLLESKAKLNASKVSDLELLHKKGEAAANVLEPILSEPPEKIGDAWATGIQKAVQDQTITPQEAAQYAQFPGMDQAKILLNTLKGTTKAISDAKDQAETREKAADANLKEIKVKLSQNAKPQDYLNLVDQMIPAKSNPGLNLRTKSEVNFAISHGDLESAQKAINEASQQVGQIEKEIDPRVQAGKVKVARAEGQARADVQAAAARGSSAALSEVPPHLVAPATAAYDKAGQEYASAHSATQTMNDFIAAAKSGNKEAVKIVPLQGALEITTAQGVHRINRNEIEQYGSAGSLYDKLAGRIGGAITGKSIDDSVLKDMSALQDEIAKNSKILHGNKVKTINKTYGSKFEPMNFDDDTGGDATASKGASSPKSYADQFPVHTK